MRRREAIALVQLAPRCRQAVCGCGGIAIDARGSAIEHGRFRRSRALYKTRLRSLDFGLVLGADNRGNVVGKHQRGTAKHRLRYIIDLDARCPRKKLTCSYSGKRTQWPRIGIDRLHQNHFHKSVLPLNSAADPSNTTLPDRIITVCSTAFSVAGTFCSTTISPTPMRSLTSTSRRMTLPTITGANPVDGSSSNSHFGLVMSAMPS